MGEGGSIADEAIEVRRVNGGVAESGDGVGGLIIGNNEEEVGSFFGDTDGAE